MIVRPAGNGLLIEGRVRVAVDSNRRFPGAVHIVTHAHFDHVGALRKGPGFSNLETSKILEIRGVYSQPVDHLEVGDLNVVFLNAGHIVGSSQVLIENGKSMLITGDFKLEPDVVVRGADQESVDVLFVDTTFGVPYFRFPSRRTLYRHLKDFVLSNLREGNSVVLLGYAVGKSQELTGILNTWGIIPYVLPETHTINMLFGLKDAVLRSLPKEPSVLILPPRFRKVLDAFTLQTGIPHVGIYVSGWNPELPLSSHADWFQTVDFVEGISPEIVVTYGANAEESALSLRKEGFNALPLTRPLRI